MCSPVFVRKTLHSKIILLLDFVVDFLDFVSLCVIPS
jgi:hypothetical protein